MGANMDIRDFKRGGRFAGLAEYNAGQKGEGAYDCKCAHHNSNLQ
jgi:hypothetical protein